MPWLYSSCEICNYCVEGEEPLCLNHEITGITRQGGYAEYMKAPSHFVTKIPDKLELSYAAPFILRRYNSLCRSCKVKFKTK